MTRLHLVTAAVAAVGAVWFGFACDRKWDFECTAVWEARDGTELSREIHSYAQMDSEQAATARCKEQMLESRPKRGKAATCHCVGKD